MKRSTIAMMSVVVLFAGGCNRLDVIPDRLADRVDRDLKYSDIKENPKTYRGKLMLTGGKVLSAYRLKEGTRIEVLQIPLSEGLIPTGRKAESNGRFVVIDRSERVSDPIIFDDKTRITVVGEVVGATTVNIDEVQQQVPELALKHITVWDWDRSGRPYAYGYPYGYGLGVTSVIPIIW